MHSVHGSFKTHVGTLVILGYSVLLVKSLPEEMGNACYK